MTLTFRGRKVVDCDIDFSGRSRDPVDAYVANATWDDTGEELTADEIDALNDCRELAGEIQDEARLRLAEGDFSPWRDEDR